ncbi:MAG: alpha/beta fold hydrolase [Balneolaceae bacterium]|nr:alpha/beta fold hydrolase [Balneolaceae bacterium]MCH8548696.1 alpha/beta fold hydrolase [Balneolaceae bacterium]
MAELQFYTDDMVLHGEIHSSRSGLPWLLMLHGFMGSGQLFSHLIPKLSEFCNPITIDLAGHGESDAPEDEKAFLAERQVEQIRSVIERISPEHLFAYGYSMGGRLLFQLITKHPELFRGAIVESSHCGITDAILRNERRDADFRRAEAIEENFTEFIENWGELPLFAATPEIHKKRYLDLMRRQSPGAMANSLRMFGAGIMPPVCRELRTLPMPLYLVAGERDLKYADRMAEMAAICPKAEFRLVKDAGHRIHTDQPDELTELIQTFINNHHV